MLSTKIPATVITGFLGAGKTTMIRNLLLNAEGRRIALIINEFGDLGVDGDVLKGCGIETCSEDDIVELNNGCICCTVADDFIPTMEQLLARKERPDHIIIETSGLALPQPLVAAFNWPEIKTQVTVDGVITVIDAEAVSQGRFAHDHHKLNDQRAADEGLDHESSLEELFEDQIRAADMIVLNKADLVVPTKLSDVSEIVQSQVKRPLKLVIAEYGRLPLSVLLGIGASTENDIMNRKSHHEMYHDHDHDHDHDAFESFVVEVNDIQDTEKLLTALKTIIAEHGVLRLKGFCSVPGKPMRQVIQAVGQRIETYFDRAWKTDEVRQSRLVVIGLHNLDKKMITAAIKAAI